MDDVAASSKRALESALEQSRRREAEIGALLQQSRSLFDREFKQAARSIFDSCKQLVGASAGYVALLSSDEKENHILFLDAGGRPCTVDPALPMPIRGLREVAYRTGRAAVNNDFSSSEWARLLPDGHVPLENVLFAPLVIQGTAVGVMGLANKPGGFSQHDIRTASAFGELAALSLHMSRTLDSLESSEERFRAVTNSALDAIVAADERGEIVLWNHAAERMFGYPSGEAVGSNVAMLMPERFRDAHQSAMTRRLASGAPPIAGKVELVGRRKDGSEFPLELSLASWRMRGDAFVTGIMRDITERRRAEDKVSASLALEQAARAEAEALAKLREHFMAILSHDLRQPLNVIMMNASALRRQRAVSEPEAAKIERIERSARRIGAMIRDLLDFTLSHSGDGIPIDPQPSDLREICRLALEEHQVTSPTRTLRFDAGGDCTGRWDRERLVQALSNLVGNALQYGARDGPVTVTARGESAVVALEVHNRGEAIPPEVLPTLFEPFRRGARAKDRSPNGLGLGLHIVREIVRAHGGTIDARSSAADGTTFSLRLPR